VGRELLVAVGSRKVRLDYECVLFVVIEVDCIRLEMVENQKSKGWE
jgi:hypothetical protein